MGELIRENSRRRHSTAFPVELQSTYTGLWKAGKFRKVGSFDVRIRVMPPQVSTLWGLLTVETEEGGRKPVVVKQRQYL